MYFLVGFAAKRQDDYFYRPGCIRGGNGLAGVGTFGT
jgi:hypothetical protein